MLAAVRETRDVYN